MSDNNYRVPKTKVGQKTFNKIISTGKKLFSKNGYQSTSINDIIEKSKVAAGTFYIYFDNKLALYLYLLDQYRTSIRNASSKAIQGIERREDMERAGIKSFLQYVKKDPLAYKVVWESLFVDQEIFREYYQSFAESYMFHMKRHLATGEIRPEIDLETASYVLMGIANFCGLQVLFKDNVDEAYIDYVTDEAMKILNQGLFLPK